MEYWGYLEGLGFYIDCCWDYKFMLEEIILCKDIYVIILCFFSMLIVKLINSIVLYNLKCYRKILNFYFIKY